MPDENAWQVYRHHVRTRLQVEFSLFGRALSMFRFAASYGNHQMLVVPGCYICGHTSGLL